MNKITVTTIVRDNKTGSVGVSMNTIDFETKSQLEKYIEIMNITDVSIPMDVKVHRVIEGISE